jgi:hypothetical protein
MLSLHLHSPHYGILFSRLNPETGGRNSDFAKPKDLLWLVLQPSCKFKTVQTVHVCSCLSHLFVPCCSINSGFLSISVVDPITPVEILTSRVFWYLTSRDVRMSRTEPNYVLNSQTIWMSLSINPPCTQIWTDQTIIQRWEMVPRAPHETQLQSLLRETVPTKTEMLIASSPWELGKSQG